MNGARSIHVCIGPIIEPLEARLLLDGTAAQEAIELFHTTPAVFIENAGQWADASVRFVHRGQGASIAHTDSGPVFELFREVAAGGDAAADGDGDEAPAAAAGVTVDSGGGGGGTGILPVSPTAILAVDSAEGQGRDGPATHGRDAHATAAELERLRFSVAFDGASAVVPVGLELAETRFNFLVGDPSGWREDVPSYETNN